MPEAVFIDPALQGHIPGVAGQLLNAAAPGEHRQGRHLGPGGVGPQPVVPAAAVAQPDSCGIAGQGRNQQQAKLLRGQRALVRRCGLGRWGGDAAAIGFQGVAAPPGAVHQSGRRIAGGGGDGRQGQLVGQ